MPASRPSPGRASGRAPGSRRPGPRQSRSRPRPPAESRIPFHPRFTGRAAVLLLVVVVLMVSYASSLRAYVQQQQHLAGLRADIAEAKAGIAELQRENKRWKDPAYVRAVAHRRFGWVLPGEVSFQVIDEDGKPLGHTDSLSAP